MTWYLLHICIHNYTHTVDTLPGKPYGMFFLWYIHTPKNMAVYTHMVQYIPRSSNPLKPRETRRLYESWRLLTYICIILGIFLGPRKRLLLYLHHFIMYLSGTPEEVTYMCIILCIFLAPRKRLLIFSSFYVFFWDPGKKWHRNQNYRTDCLQN